MKGIRTLKNEEMKKALFLVVAVALFMVNGASGQILNPVKWDYGAKKISQNEAVVFLRAKMDDGWHIYSQNVEDGGPIKTSFTFAESKDYTLVGKTAEPKPKTKYEDVFGMDVSYFDKEVVFQQRVKLTKGGAVVRGTLEFMACDATSCLPPEEVDFAIAIK